MAVVCASIFLSAQAAWAEDHNYLQPTSRYDHNCGEGGPGFGGVCQTDNAYVKWYLDSYGEFELESPDRQDVRDAIDENYRSTDLGFDYDTSPSFDGEAETDLVYQEGTLPSPFIGYAWCNDDVSGYRCDQSYIRIRGDGVYTPGLVCHETGHAVGLVHGEFTSSGYDSQDSTHLGCMVKGGVSPAATLRSGQMADINDVYPN